MSEWRMVEQEASDWQEPGVRLTETVQSGDDAGDNLISALPVFIGWTDTPTGSAAVRYISSWDQTLAFSGRWPPCLQYSVRHYFDNGGGPCIVFEGASLKATTAALFKSKWSSLIAEASALLLGEAAITLVAVPQLVSEIEAAVMQELGEDTELRENGIQAVVKALNDSWQTLLNACVSRSDLFFVLDVPTEPKVATACIQALRDDNALGAAGQHVALYGPHLVTDYPREPDPHRKPESVENLGFWVVPPCGAVLGAYVRTDATDGVWKAPANEVLAHVVRPLHRETAASGWFDVSKVSVNLIRSFAGRGTRIWGCRTLMSTEGSPFRYVQVRRAATWIEANLKQICRFAVFEPNHEITWFQLRGLCNAWLRRMWLEGGLAGSDEASAYTVLVGLNESMTATDLVEGRLIVKVGVALLHAAEFIEVKLVLKVGDEQTSGTDLLGSRAS